MNNFGVVEVASARTTTAPGWAYVPDTGINPAVAALQPAGRKRAARSGGPRSKLSLSDLSARQEAAVRKELELLDKDNFKDVAIPVPARSGGPKALSKSTPAVRKILLSQKTFANHLSDFEALGSGADPLSSSATPRPSQPQTPTPATPAASATPATTGAGASSSRRGGPSRRQQQQQQQQRASEDVEMTDAPPPPSTPSSSTAPAYAPPPSQPQDVASDAARHKSTILPAYTGRTPAPHPADADPLLVSRVPALPTDEELRALLLAPPAPYPELMARARRDQDDDDDDGCDGGGEGGGRPRFPPARVFCAVCGYWGRVKCIKCGTRVCALDCLELHREECVTRYGL